MDTQTDFIQGFNDGFNRINRQVDSGAYRRGVAAGKAELERIRGDKPVIRSVRQWATSREVKPDIQANIEELVVQSYETYNSGYSSRSAVMRDALGGLINGLTARLETADRALSAEAYDTAQIHIRRVLSIITGENYPPQE